MPAAVEAWLAPAEVVHEDEHDVGPVLGVCAVPRHSSRQAARRRDGGCECRSRDSSENPRSRRSRSGRGQRRHCGYPDCDRQRGEINRPAAPMRTRDQGHLEALEQAESASSAAGWVDPRYLPIARGCATAAGCEVALGEVSVTSELWHHPVQISAGVTRRDDRSLSADGERWAVFRLGATLRGRSARRRSRTMSTWFSAPVRAFLRRCFPGNGSFARHPCSAWSLDRLSCCGRRGLRA